MADLTSEGQRVVEDTARRYGMSSGAVRSVLEALVASGGGMAQFSHPELGGMGQWSRGGMIMIGDMFNNALKGRIDALCNELSDVLSRTDLIAHRPAQQQWQSQGGFSDMPLPSSSFFVGGGSAHWWPQELGMPASTGAQNNMRYACFPDRARLAIEINGQVSVYDTGDHWISGFSQQQSGDQSLTFSSQYGAVRLDSLALVSGPWVGGNPAPAPVGNAGGNGGDIFASIERLGALRDRGLISDAEFAAKKAELLSRL